MIGQMATVTQLHGPDISDPLAIHEDPPGFNPALKFPAVVADQQGLPIFQHLAVFLRQTHFNRQLGMLDQMAVFTVDRDKIFRFDQIMYQLQLFTAGMAGDMYLTGFFVKNFSPAAVKVVDQVADRFFVAGDKLGGEDDGVTFFQCDLLVIPQGNTHQGT